MKTPKPLSCLLLTYALFCSTALAQTPAPESLHVVKSSVNAESDKAELCLEFDKPLAPASAAHLASSLKLEADGNLVIPPNIDAAASSLCVFPLERDKSYRLTVTGLRGGADEKMAASYTQSFTIPDRSPMLAFTGRNGGINGFGVYGDELALRAINVAHAKIAVYHIADPAAMARAWQDRAQIALAPSESAYLARNKGQQVWESDDAFDAQPNTAIEQKISLRDKLPDLTPGLYLIVADANSNAASNPASKGLAPLAAAWFTKSDFALRAVRDSDGIHVFASMTDSLGVKAIPHLLAMNRKPEQLADKQGSVDGVTLIPNPQNVRPEDITTVIGMDAVGNVAFADIASLPALTNLPALGSIDVADPFAVPGNPVDLSLSMALPENPVAPGMLHVSRADSLYADFAVPPLTAGSAKLSFTAPAAQGSWTLRWQKPDGDLLAQAPFRVTANADAPHLETFSDRGTVTSDAPLAMTVKSITSNGNAAPLVGGQLLLAWQKRDPAAAGWKDYRFGTPTAILNAAQPIAPFLTDLQGAAQLHLVLPPRPQEPGLYQLALTTMAEKDSGIADALPLILPLQPQSIAIGVKPLAVDGTTDARFAQNGIARFAVIGLGADGKPRDVTGLTYQIYEEGRSFAWYQDGGRWNYKPEPQLRPIGGGDLVLPTEGGTIEWPVTAGNYQLQILDSSGHKLAQTAFSAGWDSAGTSPASPLTIEMPEILQPGDNAQAHIKLAEPAMVTAIVADTHIRKIVHEMRPKGDTIIAFTPATDWQGVSVSVEVMSKDGQLLRGIAEAALAQNPKAPSSVAPGSATVIAVLPPAALVLHGGEQASLTFAVENRDTQPETYHYAFTATSGLKIESGDKGSFALNGRQSRALQLSVVGEQPGVKEVRFEITGSHMQPMGHSWNIAVLTKYNFLHSIETITATPQQALITQNTSKSQNGEEPVVALISRRPMDGLAELLAYAYNAHPFTTPELALSIEALRLWGDTLAQSGFAPDIAIDARRQEWLMQLLNRQNTDGGFAAMLGGESTMVDTGAALTALGPDKSALGASTRALAVQWIQQRLSNTWVDEKERSDRAGAYAALAAADAIDPASLHYFSDTSANGDLPPIAEANIAAAFKHIHDPDAAAFWIKKMLDTNGSTKTIALLSALASTDALSSDDVHAAMREMVDLLRRGTAPSIADVAGLLGAIHADNDDAGDWRVTASGQTRGTSGVMVVPLNNATAMALRNGDAGNLWITTVAAAQRAPSDQPAGVSITRHIYHLNGVELAQQGKPARGETYIVELKGIVPIVGPGEQILVHDGSVSALRPIGCPLSPKLDAPAFIPWFMPRDLTFITHCEKMPYEVNVLLAANNTANEPSTDFNLVYFAHIDAASISSLVPPRVRLLKEDK